MNLLILLVIVIVSAILTVQNLQVVPLYFLGNSAKTAVLTLTLPLGVWVLFFTLAGLVTSLILRGFLRSPRPVAPQRESKPQGNSPQRPTGSSVRSPSFAPEPPNTPPSDWTAQEETDWNDREAVENWFDEEDVAQPVPVGTNQEKINAVRDRNTTAPEGDWQSDLRREAIRTEPASEEEDWESQDIYDQPSFEKERKVKAIRFDREEREEELRQLEREDQRTEELRPLAWERQRAEDLRRSEQEQQREERSQRFEREQAQTTENRRWNREPQREDPQPRSERPQQETRPRSEKPPIVEGISIFPPRSNFEVPQKPKTTTQEGTIYSYTYKEPRPRPKAPPPEPRQLWEEKPDEVFDVNYRLITPPRSPEETLLDDDEEWL